MLEEIKQQVQRKANNATQEIVLGVYQKMIDAHNTLCGCDYCKLLAEYIMYKKYRSRLRRKIEQEYYPNGDAKAFQPHIEAIEVEYWRNLDHFVKELKLKKDHLKVNCLKINPAPLELPIPKHITDRYGLTL